MLGFQPLAMAFAHWLPPVGHRQHRSGYGAHGAECHQHLNHRVILGGANTQRVYYCIRLVKLG